MEVGAIILEPNSWLVSFGDVAYQGLGIDLWCWPNGNSAAVVTTSALVRGSPCCFFFVWMKSLWFCQNSYFVQRHSVWAWKLTRTEVSGPLLEESSHSLGCWVSPLYWVLIVGYWHGIEKAAHCVPSPWMNHIDSFVCFFPRSSHFGLVWLTEPYNRRCLSQSLNVPWSGI